MTRNKIRYIFLLACFFAMQISVQAAETTPLIEFNLGEQNYSSSIQILILLTVISLAPSILIMMTCFTRIIISLNFLKSAIGTQQMPPNQIIIGLALFMTFFVMSPVFTKINTTALEPLNKGVITQEEAIEAAVIPLKEFMLSQTRDEDLKLFMDMAEQEPVTSIEAMPKEMPIYIVVPAFIISELRAGFIIGFLIYIPFIAIDMVVSSTLMSMGMMMLPPAMISLPFKILIFVLVDGWNLVIGQLVKTFY